MRTPTRLAGVAGAAALAIPAAVLAVGWFLASMREDAARREQQRDALDAGARTVAAAVREGLEELRAREDERPYYLYSYYYTPPDLIAVQESVAVSPLGRVPNDARVRGHFQLDPGSRVTTPLADPEAPPLSRQRGGEVIELVTQTLAPRLASLTREARESSETESALEGRPPRAQVNFGNTVQSQQSYSNAVLADIRASQAGQPEARERLAQRGRAFNRGRVDEESSSRAGAPGSTATGAQGERATAEPERAGRDGGAEGAAGAASYTPMAYRREGGLLYLYRVVTTDGASSVQGALLDGAVLRGRWLEGVARRHAAAGLAVTVATLDRARTQCAASAALPAPLDDLAVCARAAVHARAAASPAWRALALGGILAVIAASALARARALRRAEELAAVERAFVASVSHELRTPLTTLRMHAEMLEEGWVSEERRARVLAQLVTESGRLSRLVEDVLTFGRLADGRAELAAHEGDLGEHVRAIAEREGARLAERGITLDASGVAEGVRAKFDPTAVDQVVTNLLDNAAKYASDADEHVVTVNVSVRGARAVVCVSDRGPGIAAPERERVFERFYRGRKAVASHVAGTGLGLAIVRGLARAMGGDARVIDAPGGRGCAIEVDLALAEGTGA